MALLRNVLTGAASAALILAQAGPARAALPDDRVDFSMYGRMGIAWSLYGQLLQGKTMNLTTERAIGGRFEEGDYLEPTITAHILKKDEKKPNDTYIDMAITPAMFANNGSFLGFFSNTTNALRIELFQAYVEAGNVFIPDLTFWGGARFYRGADVHIADYFYFNDLSGQGGGVKYKGVDLAILVHSVPGDPMYTVPVSDDPDADVANRNRTMFVAQYTHKFGARESYVQGLAELHILPPARFSSGPALKPADHGWTAGAKLHLDFGNGNFNDVSFRYGSRIANGGWGGSKSFNTFGPAEPNGKYDGAFGIEAVEHFLVNFNRLFSLNGYAVFNMGRSAVSAEDIAPADRTAGRDYQLINFGVGARGFLYAHKQFHMIAEATFQGRKNGDQNMGTVAKVSVVPTIVPTGESSAWGRPHLRAIYTAGFYNEAAVVQNMSPYTQTVGPKRVGHFIGARTEWWF
jgi:maltoporin